VLMICVDSMVISWVATLISVGRRGRGALFWAIEGWRPRFGGLSGVEGGCLVAVCGVSMAPVGSASGRCCCVGCRLGPVRRRWRVPQVDAIPPSGR